MYLANSTHGACTKWQRIIHMFTSHLLVASSAGRLVLHAVDLADVGALLLDELDEAAGGKGLLLHHLVSGILLRKAGSGMHRAGRWSDGDERRRRGEGEGGEEEAEQDGSSEMEIRAAEDFMANAICRHAVPPSSRS